MDVYLTKVASMATLQVIAFLYLYIFIDYMAMFAFLPDRWPDMHSVTKPQFYSHSLEF